MNTDIDIARQAKPLPIQRIAEKLAIPEDDLVPYGKYKAKISRKFIDSVSSKPNGKLILVTALTPTPAGEGKTTTSVGLVDGLNAIGKKTIVCLREPSLGPCFGMKGGAAGGGYAQVIPMEDINLHFTGDFHAIGSAHNLLTALLDNSLYWGNAKNINPRSIEIKRVVDMNDRALRSIVSSLGKINGSPRESGFDITVASEVMAIFCLSKNLKELTERLGNITIGMNFDKQRLYAKDIQAEGAMTVLLKDAFRPNLVQTLENNPAIIHGGPFANIAHGCNSLIATQLGLKLADYAVTEAGFGADLGAEKFCNIKCAQGELKPDVAVIVATVRALKMHGGIPKNQLTEENVSALKAGMVNLTRHIENMKLFGIPIIVALNHFSGDTESEVKTVIDHCRQMGVEAHICKHWAEGGKGTLSLAESVCKMAESGTANFKPLYPSSLPIVEKLETIAKRIYRADKLTLSTGARKKIDAYQAEGFGNVPVCMAKTQYSFSNDPSKYGAPVNHNLEIGDVILNTGAGFMVAIAGEIMRMPGLPRVPAANSIHIDDNNDVQGLF